MCYSAGVTRGGSFSLDSSPQFWSATPYDQTNVHLYLDNNIVAAGESPSSTWLFSRFRLRQLLVAAGLLPDDADDVAFSLKKFLVDAKLLRLSTSRLHEVLGRVMLRDFGCSRELFDRYLRLNRLQRSKAAIVIFIFGVPGIHKSRIAVQVARRLDIPNLVSAETAAEIAAHPRRIGSLVSPPHLPRDAGVARWTENCVFAAKGLEGDLKRASDNGKSAIIVGHSIDPSIFVRSGIFKRTGSEGKGAGERVVIPLLLRATEREMENSLRAHVLHMHMPEEVRKEAERQLRTLAVSKCRAEPQQQTQWLGKTLANLRTIQEHCLQSSEFLEVVETDVKGGETDLVNVLMDAVHRRLAERECGREDFE